MRHERFEPLTDAEIEAAMERARVERARVFHAVGKRAIRALGATVSRIRDRARGSAARATTHRTGPNRPSAC